MLLIVVLDHGLVVALGSAIKGFTPGERRDRTQARPLLCQDVSVHTPVLQFLHDVGFG